MEKEFIPYEQALALKELGFDEDCFKCKIIGAEHFDYSPSDYDDFPEQKEKEVLIPTFSQAFRWFREEHQLDTSINTVYSKYNDTISKKYGGVIDDKSVFTNVSFYDIYEEAELACLKKLIEIVK
jgi:hypothetical protein